ncbi:hypothetical protein CEXT_494911 [Caerostris extrusa]|uniref:Uncharacterized protein n=1 Tax=Caerostris extrusa TaxID=172846 RepID=A0AAV4XC94_CAEEX|nr:hypothetical protein CEXT_494911 [Caerostris extrusa]
MRQKIRSLLGQMSSQLNFDRIGNHGLEIELSSKETELLIMEEQKTRDSLKQELLDLMANEALEDKLSEEIDKIKEEIMTKRSEIDHFSNTEEQKKPIRKEGTTTYGRVSKSSQTEGSISHCGKRPSVASWRIRRGS